MAILSFALQLERLEGTFYATGVDAGILSGDALAQVVAIRDHEMANAITSTLQGLGAPVPPPPNFTLPPDAMSSPAAFLNLAATLEPGGVGAYLGAGPMIQNPVFLKAAGTIAGVEVDHVFAVSNLVGTKPPANAAFAKALSKDEVLAAVAPVNGVRSTGLVAAC